jgi:hypothetical protein
MDRRILTVATLTLLLVALAASPASAPEPGLYHGSSSCQWRPFE